MSRGADSWTEFCGQIEESVCPANIATLLIPAVCSVESAADAGQSKELLPGLKEDSGNDQHQT